MIKFNKSKIVITISVFITSTFFFASKVSAALTFCDFYPCSTTKSNTFLSDSAREIFLWGTGSTFVAVISGGVFIIVKGALKMVRSEGDSKQIEAGFKSIKGVYLGIIMIIGGLIGLVLLIVFFRAGGILNQEITPPAGSGISTI